MAARLYSRSTSSQCPLFSYLLVSDGVFDVFLKSKDMAVRTCSILSTAFGEKAASPLCLLGNIGRLQKHKLGSLKTQP